MKDVLLCDVNLRPDIFPQNWTYPAMVADTVAELSGEINPSSDLITKSSLNNAQWSASELTTLMRSFDEKWNFDSNAIIAVWDANQPESDAPLGFIVFGWLWTETRTKKINTAFLDLPLLWVRPDKRGLGGTVVRHVVCHFLHYLSDCTFDHSHVSSRGMELCCHADFDSIGGEKAFAIIKDHILFLEDTEKWYIKEFIFEVGI
ncbi:hypothetical protein [Methylomonas rivi]|uniref:N-acetyltransferase domain-containing protein n=1 Tax=Methylomonas rivi TaxID=2952226 RepID=A0ABT1U387_9GAMM|nr:hypothetical protein [Methylomonas sp. WSC-6]MCQ8128296.1 hypothetical protein [Methylomonas sp. WSC-6]